MINRWIGLNICGSYYFSTKRHDVIPALVDMIREGEEYGLDDENIYVFGDGELERQEDNNDERGI